MPALNFSALQPFSVSASQPFTVPTFQRLSVSSKSREGSIMAWLGRLNCAAPALSSPRATQRINPPTRPAKNQ